MHVARVVVVTWVTLAGLGCVLWIVWRHLVLPLIARWRGAVDRRNGRR